MIKQKTVVLLFALFSVFNGNAQLNNEAIDLLIKLTLFKESLGNGEKVDTALLNNFLKVRLKIDTLKQEGFEHFDFFAISPEIDAKGIAWKDLPLVKSNCKEYILAISKGTRVVYRLKGFSSNDFPSFIRALEDLNYENIKNKKKFKYWYSVDRLDLECLFEAYKANSFDIKRYPCLHYCSELVTTM